MQKELSHTNRGFSVVEVLLAVSVFGLLVTALVGAYLYGEESTALAGNRTRATLLAEEGLEAVRNIRDAASTTLPTAGTYGLATSSGAWVLSGSSDLTDIYTRQITISPETNDRVSATSTVSWQQNAQRTGSVSATTEFTKWLKSNGCEGLDKNSLSISTSSVAVNPSDTTQVIGITISNCGGANITLDKMTVSFAGAPGGQKILGITINGGSVWSGSGSSGSLLDITNVTLDPNVATYPINSIIFKKSMAGATLTIIFTMTDGSTKTTATLQL